MTSKPATLLVSDVPCTACSCLCDDVQVQVIDGQVVEALRACDRGRQWFLQPISEHEPACQIAGQPADLEAGIERAAELLASARLPLIYGLADSNCEAQRSAVALADRLGAVIDSPSGTSHGPTLTSFPAVGEVTCTLGEIRQRSDLLVLWGADPAVTHPRFFERYVSTDQPPARVVVADRPMTTPLASDTLLQIKPGSDFEALWMLRAIIRGLEIDPDVVERQTGVAIGAWRELAARLCAARYGAIVLGEPALRTAPHLQVDVFYTLLRDVNAHARCVGLLLGAGMNQVGADQVLCWQTGFSHAVNLAQGYPRFGPGEYTGPRLLERRETDAALLVGFAAGQLPPAAQAGLAEIPWIFLGSHPPAGCAAEVVFRTAPLGVSTGGTLHRLDDLPLALRPVTASRLPTEEQVLARLASRLATGS